LIRTETFYQRMWDVSRFMKAVKLAQDLQSVELASPAGFQHPAGMEFNQFQVHRLWAGARLQGGSPLVRSISGCPGADGAAIVYPNSIS
jgi:hypothetical protein